MATREIRKQLAAVEDLLLGSGTQVQARQNGSVTVTKVNIPAVVETVDDLINIDVDKHTTAVVKDTLRGGTFNYTGFGTVNDGGIVFDGWVRQYSGAVNVKWFGNISSEQTFKNAADTSQSVEVDVGDYTFTTTSIDFEGIKFHSFGTVTTNGTNLIVSNLVP